MKKIVSIGGIVLIVFAGLLIGKDLAAKAVVESVVRFMTGLELNMRHLDVALLRTSLGIQDLRLFNPNSYQDRQMLYMPEIYVDYELQPFFQGKVHLDEVRVHLKEIMVVKNEKGELNLNSLKAVQSQKKEAAAKGGREQKGAKKEKAPQIRIDSLRLRIEKVIFKDYSKGGRPSVREFNLNLNESYSNVTNPYGVVSLIVVKVLMNTGLANLTNFDLGPLENSVSDALASSRQIAEGAVTRARKTLDETAGQAEELLDKTPESLRKSTAVLTNQTKEFTQNLSQTASGLTDKLKLSLGKKE